MARCMEGVIYTNASLQALSRSRPTGLRNLQLKTVSHAPLGPDSRRLSAAQQAQVSGSSCTWSRWPAGWYVMTDAWYPSSRPDLSVLSFAAVDVHVSLDIGKRRTFSSSPATHWYSCSCVAPSSPLSLLRWVSLRTLLLCRTGACIRCGWFEVEELEGG